MRPSGVPAASRLPSATSAGLTVPRTGATTSRQSNTLPGSGTSRLQQLAPAGEVTRAGEREDLDVGALPLALGQAGEGTGGRQLDRGRDPQLPHGGQAGVEAHRA